MPAQVHRRHLIRQAHKYLGHPGWWAGPCWASSRVRKSVYAGHAEAVTTPDALVLTNERARRAGVWAGVKAAGGPADVPAGVLNEHRVFRGGRGIYAESATTQAPSRPDGITVGLLHKGSSYADELSADGLRYHYPRTARQGRDRAEIAATKSAHDARLPLFVVTAGRPATKRTV